MFFIAKMSAFFEQTNLLIKLLGITKVIQLISELFYIFLQLRFDFEWKQ